MRVTLDDGMLQRMREARVFTSLRQGVERLRSGDAVSFADDAHVEPYAVFLSGNALPSIGSFSYSWSAFPEGVSIGRYCSIAQGVTVTPGNHPMEFLSTSSFTYDAGAAIFAQCLADEGSPPFRRFPFPQSRPNRAAMPAIGHDVWIGANAVLGRGISLGHGCVVAANAVVTRDVPPYAIVGGNPARLIRFRFDEGVITRLLESRWWEIRFPAFGDMRYDDVSRFLDELAEREAAGTIRRHTPEASRLLLRELLKPQDATA